MTALAQLDRRRGRPKSPADDPGALTAIGQSKAVPYFFSAPAIFAISLILAYPVLYGVWQSLYRPERLGLPAQWVGLQNYKETFADPAFANALLRTAIYATGSITLSTALGLFFSFALYRASGRLRLLRSMSLAPYLISSVAAAVMFRILFNGQFGLINVALSWVGIEGPDWFANPTWAMLVVIFTQVWTDLPLTVLLLLGGLMTIDRSCRRGQRLSTGMAHHHSAARAATADQHDLVELLHGDGPGHRAAADRRRSQ